MGKQAKRRQARKTHQTPRTDDTDDLVAALDLLARRRAPYARLLAAIVGDTLERFSFPLRADGAPGPIVEIGAGTGQLRDWLSPPVAARAVHTDPAPRALGILKQRAPLAPAAAARAQALPFPDRSCDGVIGLCVFDAIHAAGAEAAAVAEIARVLAPGGRFVHVLDMATLLDAPFAKLAAGGLVPIPNVFGDPADHEWPLDVLLLRRDWLGGLLQLAARAGHTLPVEFGAFFEAFLAPSGGAFDARVAADRFKALAADGERRFALSTQIASACQLAVQEGYPTLQPLPFHSGRYLASLLETTFRDSGAFRVDLSEIVTRSAWEAGTPLPNPLPAAAGRGNRRRYRSLALGHERTSMDLPARLLDESSRVPPSPDATLTEAAAYVFVATRI